MLKITTKNISTAWIVSHYDVLFRTLIALQSTWICVGFARSQSWTDLSCHDPSYSFVNVTLKLHQISILLLAVLYIQGRLMESGKYCACTVLYKSLRPSDLLYFFLLFFFFRYYTVDPITIFSWVFLNIVFYIILMRMF